MVARAIWLTMFCLLGIGPVVAMKLFSGAAPAAIIDGAPPATIAAKREMQPDTLGKADRLPVFRSNSKVAPGNGHLPTEIASSDPALVLPAKAPKIVSRHWHEPNSIAAVDRKSVHRSVGNRQAWK
jgi:hypothetical protein